MRCVCCGAALSLADEDRLYNRDDSYICPTTGQAISGHRHREAGGEFRPPERTIPPKRDEYDDYDAGSAYVPIVFGGGQ